MFYLIGKYEPKNGKSKATATEALIECTATAYNLVLSKKPPNATNPFPTLGRDDFKKLAELVKQ